MIIIEFVKKIETYYDRKYRAAHIQECIVC